MDAARRRRLVRLLLRTQDHRELLRRRGVDLATRAERTTLAGQNGAPLASRARAAFLRVEQLLRVSRWLVRRLGRVGAAVPYGERTFVLLEDGAVDTGDPT